MTGDNIDSIAYYDRNAGRFAGDTAGIDMSALHNRFLQYVPLGGRILDAGCGVGRDAMAFTERGYCVVGFDASAEMVRMARGRMNGRAEILQMRFEEVAWRDEFSGVWACASLLHVPTVELPAIVGRLAATLRPGGACYMSFKYGSGERMAEDRRFTDLTEANLDTVLTGTELAVVDAWVTGDVRAGRTSERWLNAVAKKPLR